MLLTCSTLGSRAQLRPTRLDLVPYNRWKRPTSASIYIAKLPSVTLHNPTVSDHSNKIIIFRAGPYAFYFPIQLLNSRSLVNPALSRTKDPLYHPVHLFHYDKPSSTLLLPATLCHVFNYNHIPPPRPPRIPHCLRRFASNSEFSAPSPPNRTRPRLRQFPNLGLRGQSPNLPIRLHGCRTGNVRQDPL